MELKRWSLISTDPSVPQPLAMRVPLEVRGLSLALGPRELILAPSASSGENCNDCAFISVEVSTLLSSARYASSGDLRLTFRSRGEGLDSARRSPTPPDGLMRSPIMSQEGSAERGKSEEAINERLEDLLGFLVQANAAFLSGNDSALTGRFVDAVVALERTLVRTEEREEELTSREARLQTRVERLARHIAIKTGTLDKWNTLLLDAIAHQRGESAFRTANDRLGKIHVMLSNYERQLKALSSKVSNLQGRDERVK